MVPLHEFRLTNLLRKITKLQFRDREGPLSSTDFTSPPGCCLKTNKDTMSTGRQVAEGDRWSPLYPQDRKQRFPSEAKMFQSECIPLLKRLCI